MRLLGLEVETEIRSAILAYVYLTYRQPHARIEPDLVEDKTLGDRPLDPRQTRLLTT